MCMHIHIYTQIFLQVCVYVPIHTHTFVYAAPGMTAAMWPFREKPLPGLHGYRTAPCLACRELSVSGFMGIYDGYVLGKLSNHLKQLFPKQPLLKRRALTDGLSIELERLLLDYKVSMIVDGSAGSSLP